MSTTKSITPEEYRAFCKIWELDEDEIIENTPQIVIPSIEYGQNNTYWIFLESMKMESRKR